MKNMRSLLALGALVLSGTAFATITEDLVKTRTPMGEPVVPGVWHAGLEETKAYAEKHGLPMVAVWSNGDGCSHCIYFERSVMSEAFREFMKSSGIVFMFSYCKDKDAPEGGATHKWCSDGWKTSGYPYVRFWWKKDGKELVNMHVNGDTVRNRIGQCNTDKLSPGYPDFVEAKTDKGTYNPSGRYVAWYILNKAFKGWTPEPPVPPYTGGDLVFGDVAGARLEAVAGQAATTVGVPVTRTNEQAVAVVSTNTLAWTAADGKTKGSEKIVWKADERQVFVAVPVAQAEAGESIVLELKDADGQVVATRHIAYVAAPANAPSNPTWKGAKVGEWTMDLRAATNLVKAGTAKYALAVFSGALWCPWCVGLERDVFSDADIKSYLSAQKIVPVMLDNPHRDDTPPSLLRYETGFSYGLGKDVSGADYLSRNGISSADAEAVLKRNHDLGYSSVLAGGMCPVGQERLGYPTVLLIGPSGRFVSVAIEDRSDFKFQADAFKRRLAEAMTVLTDDKESANNQCQTTQEKAIGSRDISIVNRQVSACDAVDVYPISETCKGKHLYFGISGLPATNVTLSLVQLKDGVRKVIETVTNAAGTVGMDLQAPTADSAAYYLEVAANAGTDPFRPDSKGSSFYAYSLGSDFILVPEEEQKKAVIDDGNYSVTMQVEEGETYKLFGVDDAQLPAGLKKAGSTPNLYISEVEGQMEIALLDKADFKYQLWKTGSLSFDKAVVQVNEDIGTCNIVVSRVGGTAGVAEGYVKLNAEKTTTLSEIYVWAHDNETNRWEEGEADDWTLPLEIVDNTYSDGNQKIVLDLFATKASDAGVKVGEVAVTVVENNTRSSGKIAMTDATPAFAKTMNVVAKGGTKVAVVVTRTGGADGDVGAGLTTSAGALSDSHVSWGSRQGGAAYAKTIGLALPAFAEAKKATVKLVADKGTALDSSAKTLTVEIVPETAVEFSQASGSLSCFRYVEMKEFRVAVNPATIAPEGGKVSVSKVSGSLPPGVKMAWDAEKREMVFSGVPTKAGPYKAVYRAKQGSVAGLTYMLTADVVDPAQAPAGGAAINPNVGKTLNFDDLVVIDERVNDRMQGLISLSFAKNGKASAKYRSVDRGTVSFSAKNWTRLGKLEDIALKDILGKLKAILDEQEYAALSGIDFAVAELSGTTKATAALGLTVGVGDEGEIFTIFEDPADESFSKLTVLAPTATWSKQNKATVFKGSYTVNFKNLAVDGDQDVSDTLFCRGDAYATLKLTTDAALKAGKTTYAGCLPNGKAFSGSGVLQPYDNADVQPWDRTAILPLALFSTTDDFTALLEVAANAKDVYQACRRVIRAEGGISPYWQHKEKKSAEASYATEFDAHGAYYDGDNADDFLSCCQQTFGTQQLAFFAVSDTIRSGIHGAASVWSTNTTGVTVQKNSSKKVEIKVTKSSNDYALKLTFSRTTGVVNGTFKCPFEDGKSVSMTYRGVVLPGFGVSGCTDCGWDSSGAQERPFISGSCWLTEKFENASVKRGGLVTVGTEEGK